MECHSSVRNRKRSSSKETRKIEEKRMQMTNFENIREVRRKQDDK